LGLQEAQPPSTNYSQLEVVAYKQFKVGAKKFELSGMARSKDNFFVINDKSDPNIYKVSWELGEFTPYKKIETKDNLDIEAVAVCGDTFYLSNEKNNAVYKLDDKGKTTN